MKTDTKSETLVKDKSGRIVFKIINDKMMVMRLPDMDEYTKNILIFVLNEYNKDFKIDMTEEKLRNFLNFEDDNNENEFCS